MSYKKEFYKKFKNQVTEEIRYFFYFEFDIELEDSPQILDDYLYLEFWHAGRQTKIRIPYTEDVDTFLEMDMYDREYFIMREVLDKILD